MGATRQRRLQSVEGLANKCQESVAHKCTLGGTQMENRIPIPSEYTTSGSTAIGQKIDALNIVVDTSNHCIPSFPVVSDAVYLGLFTGYWQKGMTRPVFIP